MEQTNILVVDDLRSIRLTLGGILEDKGYNVVTVEDGYRAIEAVKKSHFDAIFMDHEIEIADANRQQNLIFQKEKLLKSAIP